MTEVDGQLGELIRGRLTDERLAEDWDRLRGVAGGAAATRRSSGKTWAALNHVLWLARLPQKLAGAVSVAAVLVLAGWFTFRGGAVRMHTPDLGLMGAALLPANLRVDFRDGKAVLSEPAVQLLASLGSSRGGSTTDSRVFEVRFEGQTKTGEPMVFSGVMVVTNAPGVSTPRRASDVLGVMLAGELILGDQPPRTVRQPFLP